MRICYVTTCGVTSGTATRSGADSGSARNRCQSPVGGTHRAVEQPRIVSRALPPNRRCERAVAASAVMVTTFRKPGLAAWQGRGSAGGFRVPCRYNARRQPGNTREHQIGQVDSPHGGRSEEHTSALQSLMRNSYDIICLKKKNNSSKKTNTNNEKHLIQSKNIPNFINNKYII